MATYKGYTYSNGNVPKAVLSPLDGDNYGKAELRDDAAASWNRARAEVKAKTGITLTVRGWNRSLAEQERFFFQRYRRQASGGTDVRWYKGVRYARFTGAPAAIPGTSNHGWGTTVDVNDYGAYGTKGNARRSATIGILKKHGWTDSEGQSIAEPWHLEYVPARDTQKNSKTTTPQRQEPDMDATQAKQLSTVHHILTSARVEDFDGKQTFTDALRRLLVIGRRNGSQDIEAAVARGVKAYAASTPGVDEAKLTAGVVAEVRKAVTALTDSVEGTEYVLTPKEN